MHHDSSAYELACAFLNCLLEEQYPKAQYSSTVNLVSRAKVCLTAFTVSSSLLPSHDAHTWEDDNAYLPMLALALLSY
jgi:hypothetical protein